MEELEEQTLQASSPFNLQILTSSHRKILSKDPQLRLKAEESGAAAQIQKGKTRLPLQPGALRGCATHAVA